MSDAATTQEVRTDFIWNTDGVDKGESRILQAQGRVEKSEQALSAAGIAREQEAAKRRYAARQAEYRDLERATEASNAKMVAATKGMHSELERAEKESNARRAQETRRAYSSMDTAAANRQRAIVSGLRVTGETGGTRAGGGGGHGGHGGMGNARYIGDALDAATGSTGWVLRMRALQHFGAGAAGIGALGFLGFKGVQANSENDRSTDALRAAMGLGGENARFRGMFSGTARFLDRIAPGLAGDRYSIGRGDAESAEGIHGQREELTKAIDEYQKQHRGFGAVWRGIGSVFDTGSSERDAFGAANAAGVKRDELDARSAGLIGERTAAARTRAFGGEYAGGMAESALKLKEEIAGAADELRDGKIGRQEYFARRSAAGSDAELRERDLGLARDARARGVGYQDDQTYIRGRGEDVAQRSAYSRFNAAQDAMNAAADPESREKARAEKDAAYQDYVEAERATRERKAVLKIDQQIAEFRGSAEARTLNAAEQEVTKKRELLTIAKEAGIDAAKAAQLELSRAELNLDLTKQEQAAQRNSSRAGLLKGDVNLRSAAFTLGQRTDTADENVRFAAGQAIARNSAAAAVQSASIEAERASATAKAQPSDSNTAAELVAQQQLVQAKIGQLSVEKQLTFEAHERERTIQRAVAAARNETGAMHLATGGRGDLAGLQRSRFAAQQQADEFRHNGRADLAAEVENQQNERELGQINGQLLGPDGRPNRAAYNRAERAKRQAARRTEAFDRRLEQNGGLLSVSRDISGNAVDGIDPLTHKRVRAKDRADRLAEIMRKEGGAADAIQQFPQKDQGVPGAIEIPGMADLKTVMDNLYTLIGQRLPEIGATP